jgi:hypothetical protein
MVIARVASRGGLDGQYNNDGSEEKHLFSGIVHQRITVTRLMLFTLVFFLLLLFLLHVGVDIVNVNNRKCSPIRTRRTCRETVQVCRDYVCSYYIAQREYSLPAKTVLGQVLLRPAADHEADMSAQFGNRSAVVINKTLNKGSSMPAVPTMLNM